MIPSEPIHRPVIPFVDNICGGVKSGSLFTIKGVVPTSTKSFQINFACGPVYDSPKRSPVAFHFNPRMNERYVARNSFLQPNWGKEEANSPNKYFPFAPGQKFEIMVLVEEKQYKVAVNGRHFITYQHRIPLASINTLQILGEIEIHEIYFENNAMQQLVSCSSPTESLYEPPIPFFHDIQEGFTVGKTFYISGRPLPYSNRFSVDLICSNPCKSLENIALHINPRFSPPCVVRNSRINGKWGSEEREDLTFPFERNISFDLKIVCEEKRYKLFINGQYFCAFIHRLPFESVTKLGIEGEVSISSIMFN